MRFHGLDFMKFEENSKLLNRYLPAVLFLVAFFWKLPYINVRDISLDEPYSIYNAQKGVIDIIKISTEGEPTPPLFMLLLHFWIKLFGLEPASVRFLPLIFNALTVVFVYLTGKRFFSFWAGIIASGFFLFSTAHFFHGLETRAYSLKALETAAFALFLSRIYQKPQRPQSPCRTCGIRTLCWFTPIISGGLLCFRNC